MGMRLGLPGQRGGVPLAETETPTEVTIIRDMQSIIRKGTGLFLRKDKKAGLKRSMITLSINGGKFFRQSS